MFVRKQNLKVNRVKRKQHRKLKYTVDPNDPQQTTARQTNDKTIQNGKKGKIKQKFTFTTIAMSFAPFNRFI